MSTRRAPRSAVLGLAVAAVVVGGVLTGSTMTGAAAAPGPTATTGVHRADTSGTTRDPTPARISPSTTDVPAPGVPAPEVTTPEVTAPEVTASAAVSEPQPLRGDEVTVTGTGFAPDEEVSAALPSRTRGRLGSAVADTAGRVAIPFTVPTGLPTGDQEVRLTGTSGATASTGFELRTHLQELPERLLRPWRR